MKPSLAKESGTREVAERLHRLASYFSASIDIRNSITLQHEDERFSRDERGSIRYLFDANVVRFFLDPCAESSRVNPFSDIRSKPYRKLAIITAEFVFSREMEGQWGMPAMISPSHMEELSDHMNKLASRLNEHADALAGEGDPRRKEEQDHRRAIRLAQASETLGPSVDAFNALVPYHESSVQEGWVRELREAEIYDRLRHQDLLSPLHLDENATLSVLEPLEVRKLEWIARIRAQRDRDLSGARQVHDRPRSPLQDEADGETAEQVIQLNHVAREGNFTPVRYVLITLDRHLFNAAVEWWESGGRNELDFFPFRRLSQYIPFLNTERMPNTIESKQVREQLETALDSLLGIGSRRRQEMPLYIPDPFIAPPSHTLAGEIYTTLEWIVDRWRGAEQIQERIVTLWREMTERANYLNPELLSRRDEAYETFADFLANSPNTRQAAVVYLRRAVARVEAINIELSVAHNIGKEIAKKPEYHAAQAVRGMPVLRERFEKLLKGEPLYPFLDDVMLNRDINRLTPIVRRLGDEPRWRAGFFAGCIAFWAGQWDGAAAYARRALSTAEPDAWLAELTYFRVLTGRFAGLDLPSKSRLDTRRALRIVGKELESQKDDVDAMIAAAANDDDFAESRARLEQALWQISVAFVRGFLGEASSEGTVRLVEAARHNLGAGQRRNVDRYPAGIPCEALKTMHVEQLIGEAACLIFQASFSGAPVDTERSAALAEELEDCVAHNRHIAPTMYKIVVPLLRVGAARLPQKRQSAAKDAASAIENLLEEGHHMTWFDGIGLSEMRKLMLASARE